MPHGDPEPDDPHLLVGVSLPGDEATVREMAAAFADEFAQMGFDRERLLKLFRDPFYAGAHAARRLLGDAEVARIVIESLRVYGGRGHAILDAAADDPGPERSAVRQGRRTLRTL